MDNNLNIESNDANNDPNLDSILDDALGDFNKPIIPKKPEDDSSDATAANTNVWTDEFITAATQNFESTMKSIITQQKDDTGEEACDESPNALDLGAMSAEFAKFAEAAAKAATESSTDQDFTQCLANTMQQMAKNQEEAQIAPSSEELGKMFEGLGLGGAGGADESDLGGLFPIMQTMLENILSKEILYPPMKEIVTKYPDWLADNRNSLPEEEYSRYNNQYDIMKQVVDLFEKESDGDSVEVKSQASESILLLMQKLQELGQPPKDLIGDYDPLPGMDPAGSSLQPDLGSLLGGAGFPCFGLSNAGDATGASPAGKDASAAPEAGGEQCRVM